VEGRGICRLLVSHNIVDPFEDTESLARNDSPPSLANCHNIVDPFEDTESFEKR